MKFLKQKLNIFYKIISQFLAEIFVIVGLFFIVFAVFKFNTILGYLILGGVSLALGLFIARMEKR